MTIYEAKPSFFKIELIECVKETPSQFSILSETGYKYRVAKKNSFSAYFKTYKEARDYIINEHRKIVETLEGGLERAKNRLNDANNIPLNLPSNGVK